MENVTDMKDVFQKLMKNPTKLMGLVKTVGDKLDGKMKSGAGVFQVKYNGKCAYSIK